MFDPWILRMASGGTAGRCQQILLLIAAALPLLATQATADSPTTNWISAPSSPLAAAHVSSPAAALPTLAGGTGTPDAAVHALGDASQILHPQVMDPQVMDPQVMDPRVTDPQSTAPPALDPLEDDRLWQLAPPTESNRGELAFLQHAPDKPVHHHVNQITLTHTSLEDGWVQLHQCHHDLDRVRRAQILYSREGTSDLEIESQQNIGESWVRGASVQLQGVQEGAQLCVKARSRMLEAVGDGHYILRNGPFMRRFLDGYFPMRVTVIVDWGNLGLDLLHTTPEAQPGFVIAEQDNGLILEAHFEGRLNTALHLTGSRTGQPNIP
jgi:hypothetical protein